MPAFLISSMGTRSSLGSFACRAVDYNYGDWRTREPPPVSARHPGWRVVGNPPTTTQADRLAIDPLSSDGYMATMQPVVGLGLPRSIKKRSDFVTRDCVKP